MIDKDNGIYFSVEWLRRVKAEHEASVKARMAGASTERETFLAKRQDLLLEAASASRGRLIARWLSAGVSPALAQELADDDSVGSPARLGRDLPENGLLALVGDFGSGKSVTAERIHQADVAAALDDEAAPVALYLNAKTVTGPLIETVSAAANRLGDPRHVSLRLVLDGLDEPGPARAAELLDEARALAFTWPNTRVLVTVRPNLTLQTDEWLDYPPLSDDEAGALAERLGGNALSLWLGSATAHHMLHLPLFLIVAVLRQQAGAEIPQSQGAFLRTLADTALAHAQLPRTAADTLQRLARLTVGLGGGAPAAEMGRDEDVRLVLETRLIVRHGRTLRFALPVVEQYFAARFALEAGLDEDDFSDLQLLDRWRDSLLLAVTTGAWRQVTTLLDILTAHYPGFAAQLVADAVPSSPGGSNAEVPGQQECGRRMHHALSSWVRSLGAAGQRLGLTDSAGRVRTLGVATEGGVVTVAMRDGDSGGADTVPLPSGPRTDAGVAIDGSRWQPFQAGRVAADFAAWPWAWALEQVSAGIESILEGRALPLPGSEPFQDEQRWQLMKAIMGKETDDQAPLVQTELRTAAEQLLSRMDEQGITMWQPYRRYGLSFTKDQVTALASELDAIGTTAADTRLHRAYPAPDVAQLTDHPSDSYSDEPLRILAEQVYTNALLIYRDLVETWFAPLAPTLGMACMMPILLRGEIERRPDSTFGDPGLFCEMEPLPVSDSPRAELRFGPTPDNLHWIERESLWERMARIRTRIAELHPEAGGWAQPRIEIVSLNVWSDAPATRLAYLWLWSDLQALRLLQAGPPYGRD